MKRASGWNTRIQPTPLFVHPPQVAIKAMSLKGLRDWKQLELFQREAVVLQSLTHPSIPRW